MALNTPEIQSPKTETRCKAQWKFAAQKIKKLADPWAKLNMASLQEEVATRHMYNPRTKKWRKDEIVVKIQAESFAHGAMRECFRMKKLSKFSQNPDWKNASNYVAKRYIKPAQRDTYFEDVKLQMDTKLWGEEYNKLGVVPKKVDFCQTYIIEFKGREDSPLYGVEHFIDGGYVKYNSNSGFVSDLNRLTPQTFSHFTFERSGHQLIIVDIQGVGDLYTDPQMHTVDQADYGEANLGVRGMALFFSSHICSPLCKALGLTQFDLSKEEIDHLLSKRWTFSSSTTKVVSAHQTSPSAERLNPMQETLEQAFHRLSATMTLDSLKSKPSAISIPEPLPESPLPLDSPFEQRFRILGQPSEDPAADGGAVGEASLSLAEGVRLESSSAEEQGTKVREKGVFGNSETNPLKILGLIHIDLAKLHEAGRFCSDGASPDDSVMLYHLDKAAGCLSQDALYTLARINLQRSHEEFSDLCVKSCSENWTKGLGYLRGAADEGHRAAMFELAQILDNGCETQGPDWSEAVVWYSKALSQDSTDSLAIDPEYTIVARLAAMHQSGGNGLAKNPQKAGELYSEAAEAAMAAMKGKLSNKYYMLAEEAWSELEN